MNRKAYVLSTLLAAVLASVNVFSQDLWSLEKCIDYANENNLAIQQSMLDVYSADEDLSQSKLNMLPSLNGSLSENYNWGRNLDPQTNLYVTQQTQQFRLGINSEITLFNGLQQINNVKQKQFEYLAKKYDSDKIRNDISLNIAAGYLLILFNLELVNNAQRQVDISNEQIGRTEKQVEAGVVARGNLFDIQAQGANDEANLITARNNLMLAYLDLKQMLDLEADTDFDIEKPDLNITGTPTLVPPDVIYNTAVTIMPEIKSAESSVESAERSLAIARGARSPRIYASGQYGSTFSDQIYEIIGEDPVTGLPIRGPDVKSFDSQLVDNRFGGLFFGLQIPIFNGYQVSTNVKKTRVYMEVVEINLAQQKLALRKNIETAYADAVAAYQTYVARKKSVDAFAESFKYMEEKFDVGMVNATEYNVAKIQYSSAESELANAKYDYIFKVKVLDFYLGNGISLDDIATSGE
jgi:outer membrane protein